MSALLASYQPLLLDLAEGLPSADTGRPFGTLTQNSYGRGANEALIFR